MIGTTLAHYEILSELGRGAMGEVYRARDPRLDRDVAIKILPPDFAVDPARRRRFEDEARALAALNHPNTVSIFDFGIAEGVAYAVMELVEGQTLQAELEGGALQPGRAVELAVAISRGLAAAHGKGILHGDLKPANVMLTPDGQVKLLDFGLARRITEPAADETTQVMPGLEGTPGYIAPERITGAPAVAASDLFALGVVMYEMVAGRNPFLRPSTPETLSAILEHDPPAIPRLPQALASLIESCLHKDPRQRSSSAGELAAQLAGCLAAPAPDSSIRSIAVLPLHNEANDEDAEYLIDGLTDSLIDTLSQLPQLKVLARSTVFQRRDLHDRPEVAGRELGVSAVLAGRLQRRGNNLVIRVELVDSKDGTRLWGDRLRSEGGDLFEIEEQICEEITAKLRLKLTPDERQRINRRSTSSLAAREAYMRGRYTWNRWKTADAMRTAIGFFERALELDPLFADAFAGLADSYAILGNVKALPPEVAYPKALTAVRQGLAIDDQLAELHSSLGFIQRHWEWDWEAARHSFDRALELNPGYATAHRFSAHLHSGLAEHDRAIESVLRALELDPLSLILHTSVGDAYFYARRFEEAMRYYRKSIEMDAGFLPGHTDLARALELSGRYEEALAEFELAATLAPEGPPEPSAGLACVLARMGRHDEARHIIEELLALSSKRYISPYGIGSIYACMGENGQALDWLEKAYESHDQTLVWVGVHPRLERLHGEPRYQAILEKMKLASAPD